MEKGSDPLHVQLWEPFAWRPMGFSLVPDADRYAGRRLRANRGPEPVAPFSEMPVGLLAPPPRLTAEQLLLGERFAIRDPLLQLALGRLAQSEAFRAYAELALVSVPETR